MEKLTAAFFITLVLALGLFSAEKQDTFLPIDFPPMEVTDVAIVDEDIDFQELIRQQGLMNESQVFDCNASAFMGLIGQSLGGNRQSLVKRISF